MEQNKPFQTLFTEIFRKNGLDSYITNESIEKFGTLTEIMLETNRVMNITALTTVEKIIPLHYADCVMIADCIPKGATVIDIGCGGGFPILPLAIVRPDLKLTGVDSTEKKVRYVSSAAGKLGLNIKTVSGRAEELAHVKEYREQYDVAISRAVARLNVLDELCMPFVKVGGIFIAMKGSAGMSEMAESQRGIDRLGGRNVVSREYSLHLSDETERRTLLLVNKETETPKEFPRAFGSIKKKPL